MAKVIMFAGGCGTQAGYEVPGVCTETCWDDNNVSDLMDANGGYLINGSYTLTYNAGGSTLSGDFSSCKVHQYAFVNCTGDGANHYLEITAITSTTSCTLNNTSLDNYVLSAADDYLSFVKVGGAASKGANNAILENCNDYILSYITEASVDVLYNKSESTSVTIYMDTSSSLLYRIRYIGTVYDGSTVNNNFAAIDAGNLNVIDDSTFPTITITSAATFWYVTGAHTFYKHIKWTGDCSNAVLHFRGKSTLFQCSVYQTNVGATYGRALYLTYSSIINCKIESVGTNDTAIVYCGNTAYIINCFIKSETQGINLYNGTSLTECIGNIIIGGSAATRGIVVSASDSLAVPGGIINNIIYNFDDSIYIAVMSDVADKELSIFNNIIWGNNAAGSYGIYNVDVATKTSTIYINNNFIGNVENEGNFGENDIGTISLTTIPFTSATPANAEDFYLNDTADGGALVKNKMIPMDFDFDGVQDNFQTGAITAEPSGGGGRIMRERWHNV